MEENNSRIATFEQFKKAIQNMSLDNLVLKQTPKMTKYNTSQVKQYLENPISNQENLRKVIDNLCEVYPQLKSIVEYLPNNACLNYVLLPIKKPSENSYKKVAEYVKKLNINNEYIQGIHHNFKYDTFFAYEIEDDTHYFLKVLPQQYCRICGRDMFGCFVVEFNFSYFNGKEKLIYGDDFGRVAYPDEFKKKYAKYQKDKTKYLWQPLDYGIATKYDTTQLDYSIPPFVGLFNNLIEIEDMRQLAKAKAENDVWKILSMEIPLRDNSDKNNDFKVDMDVIEYFMQLAKDQVPDGIGIIPSPLPVQSIKLSENTANQRNELENSIKLLFQNSGFADCLFGGAKGVTELKYSVKVDEQRLFGLYRQYENIINKKIYMKFRDSYRVKILDMSNMRKEEVADELLKVAQVSAPCKNAMMASLGFEPADILGMTSLENDVLKLYEAWKPLQSSYTQSTNEGGRPSNDNQVKEDGKVEDV